MFTTERAWGHCAANLVLRLKSNEMRQGFESQV